MSVWTNKPCAGCGRRKGRTSVDRKYCHRCGINVRRVNAELAHRRRVARTYGMAPDDYDRLYAAQDGRCALCRRATGATRRLSVDHDHASGDVRGLLCRRCNDVLGHARDDRAYFRRCIEYLTRPPARDVLAELAESPPAIPGISSPASEPVRRSTTLTGGFPEGFPR